MRHKDGQGRVGKNVARRATENHLTQSTLRVRSFDQEVAPEGGGCDQNSSTAAPMRIRKRACFYIQSVPA